MAPLSPVRCRRALSTALLQPAPLQPPRARISCLLRSRNLLKRLGLDRRRVDQNNRQRARQLRPRRCRFLWRPDNVPELRASAEYLKEVWERMGAQVNVQIYDQGDLSQNVIRPRKYDALLFGEVTRPPSSICSHFGTQASATTLVLTSPCMPTRLPTRYWGTAHHFER